MPFTPKFVDLVRNAATVQGTGPITLGAAATGFTSLAVAVAAGEQFYYCLQGTDKPAEREVGRGTMQADGTVARQPIDGAPTNFTAGAKTIALIAAAEWFTAIAQGGAGAGAGAKAGVATSRSAIAAETGVAGEAILLSEAGREGLFIFDAANLSAKVAGDPRQAVHIAPASAPTGASGAWVRKYSGGADARWFGVKGGGAADDAGALQAWLDFGGHLYLPKGKYRSSARLLVRKYCNIEGAGYGFDARVITAGGGLADMPGSQLLFDAGVAGLYFMNQSTVDNVELNAANQELYRTQEGALLSRLANVGVIGSGGAAATGIYIRTGVYLDGVQVYNFSGTGFDYSASSDVSDGNSEFGGASVATLTRCLAKSNGSHGFHIRGRDANVIKLDTCNASVNGGWGFLDDSLLGNTYINCHAATNTLGSYKATSAVGDHSYIGCYVEPFTGSNAYIGERCAVIGAQLASIGNPFSAYANDAPTMPSILGSAGASNINDLRFTDAQSSPGAITGSARIYRHGDQGLVLQGHSNGAYDLAFKNEADQLVLGVLSGTRTVQFQGETQFYGNLTIASGVNLSLYNSNAYELRSFFETGTNNAFLMNVKGGVGYAPIFIRGSAVNLSVDNAVVASVTSTGLAVTGTVGATGVVTAASVAASGLVTGSNLSGVNSGDQVITLTGAISGSGTGSFATSIAAKAVTLDKMADVASGTLFYRKTAASGEPEVQTLAVLKADLGLSGTNSGDQSDVTGNAGTATALQTPRTINGVAFDGSANISINAVDSTARVPAARLITTSAPLTGGGDLSADRTLAISAASGTGAGSMSAADFAKLGGIATGATANSTDAFLLARANHSGTSPITTASFAATARIAGRVGIGAGAAEELTGTQATALLDTFGTAKGLVPGVAAATDSYLRADATFASALTPASLSSPGSVRSSGATAGVGYATGAGGAVTQLTSKATAVTLNKASGQVTMSGAALAASASVSFTLANSAIAATDTVNINIGAGATANAYMIAVDAVAAGSCRVHLRNISAASLSEALLLNFAVLKAVAA